MSLSGQALPVVPCSHTHFKLTSHGRTYRYNAIGCVSSGDVYYALSSESPTDGGRLYKYNPTDDVVVPLGDLTAMCDRGT